MEFPCGNFSRYLYSLNRLQLLERLQSIFSQLSPERVLFVYREGASDTTGYRLEAFFWHPNIEYKFEKNTTNRHLDNVVECISNLVSSFVAIPTLNLENAPPGFCIENGVFTHTSTDFRSEKITIKGSIKDYPGLEFDFSTSSTNKKFDDKTLLQRHESSYGLGDAMAQTMKEATKYLRKGKRTLSGQAGEELAASFTIDGKTSMNGTAEFYGDRMYWKSP